MAGKGIELSVQILNIDAFVDNALGAVDQHMRACIMGEAHDFFDGHDGTQNIRDMRNGYQPGFVT